MKVLNLGYPEQMLMALLRSVLHQREVETACFQQATEEDWVKCFKLAVHQGVSALAWEGIGRIPAKYAPPLNVKISWALREKEQLGEYIKQCKAINALTKLLAQNGIGVIVLKGVGLSRLYPVPAHRESGDIDIYTYSADRTVMTDEQANRLADEILLKEGAVMDETFFKKHSKIGLYGVTFENHRMFLHIDECKSIAIAEQWLQKHLETQTVELVNGKLKIEVPTVNFDSVFVSLHAAQHYGEGLSLKHLCDLVLLMQQKEFSLPDELDNKHIRQSIATLTQLCNQYLGLSVTVNAEVRKLATRMMQEILYPPHYGNSAISQLQNRIHIFRQKHKLLGVSFWGKLGGWMARKVKWEN